MEILRTEKVTKWFGGLSAVLDVDLTLEKHEIQSIIGPNGAGKSTLFRLINGEMRPSSGNIWFNGEYITGMNQASVSLKGIAMSYQITNIFPKLSTFENVRLAVQSRKTAYNLWSKSESDVAVNGKAGDTLKITGLYGKKDVLAGNLSYGDKRRLEIAIAIGSKPILLLMDEPTSGLSPVETNEMVALVKRIAKGLSVILVEHKMKVVMDLSDKITVLHQGRVIARGDPGRIREDETVRRVYLGGVRV